MPLNDTTRKWSKPPEQHNWTTKVFARSAREAFGLSPAESVAIHVYRRPLHERIVIWLLFRFGWALVLGAVLLLSGCIGPDDADTAILIAQDLQDAVQQAKEAR